MARQSYFAEMKYQNRNPMFFNNVKEQDLRNAVKRIIKDIKYDNIDYDDYAYFQNESVLNACIAESEYQWKHARIIECALSAYRNEYLYKGNAVYQTFDNTTELMHVGNELTRQTKKCNCWKTIFEAFYSIKYYHAGIHQALSVIKNIDFRGVEDL